MVNSANECTEQKNNHICEILYVHYPPWRCLTRAVAIIKVHLPPNHHLFTLLPS